MPPGKPTAADPHAGPAMPAQTPKPLDPHAGHRMPAQPPQTPDPHAGHDMSSMTMQSHPSSEEGNPLVDMQTMMPTSRLDDPGSATREADTRLQIGTDLEVGYGGFYECTQ